MAMILPCLFKFVERFLFYAVCTWIIVDTYTDSFYAENSKKIGHFTVIKKYILGQVVAQHPKIRGKKSIISA